MWGKKEVAVKYITSQWWHTDVPWLGIPKALSNLYNLLIYLWLLTSLHALNKNFWLFLNKISIPAWCENGIICAHPYTHVYLHWTNTTSEMQIVYEYLQISYYYSNSNLLLLDLQTDFNLSYYICQYIDIYQKIDRAE